MTKTSAVVSTVGSQEESPGHKSTSWQGPSSLGFACSPCPKFLAQSKGMEPNGHPRPTLLSLGLGCEWASVSFWWPAQGAACSLPHASWNRLKHPLNPEFSTMKRMDKWHLNMANINLKKHQNWAKVTKTDRRFFKMVSLVYPTSETDFL